MSDPPDNANNSLLSSLSVEEAAAALRVSGQTIRRRLKRGELRGEKIIGPTGSEWRVYRDGPLTPAEQALGPVEQALTPIAPVGGPPFQVVDVGPVMEWLRETLKISQQQATRIAQLEAENVALREKVAELAAQHDQQLLSAPRRPWWRVWER